MGQRSRRRPSSAHAGGYKAAARVTVGLKSEPAMTKSEGRAADVEPRQHRASVTTSMRTSALLTARSIKWSSIIDLKPVAPGRDVGHESLVPSALDHLPHQPGGQTPRASRRSHAASNSLG